MGVSGSYIKTNYTLYLCRYAGDMRCGIGAYQQAARRSGQVTTKVAASSHHGLRVAVPRLTAPRSLLLLLPATAAARQSTTY